MKDNLQYDLMLKVNDGLTRRADKLERERMQKEHDRRENVRGWLGMLVFVLLILVCGYVEGMPL